MPKNKQPKDPWADLSPEFRDAVEQGTEAEIRSKLADTALNTQTLLDAQEQDLDLQEKKIAAKEANAVYADGLKENKLKVKFMKRVLTSRGRSA